MLRKAADCSRKSMRLGNFNVFSPLPSSPSYVLSKVALP